MMKSSDIDQAMRIFQRYQNYRQYYDAIRDGSAAVYLRVVSNGETQDFDSDPLESIAESYLRGLVIAIEDELTALGVEIEDAVKSTAA